MIKRVFLSILLLLTFIESYSQELIGRFQNDLKTDKVKLSGSHFIQNEKTGETVVFFSDQNHVYANRFDRDLSKKDDIKATVVDSKYKKLLGASIEENGDYIVYLSNKISRTP